jgi:hypothetical protein
MEELIPELATGGAVGEERAHALRHLTGCARCRSELASVMAAADALLLLTPEREPPAGFETRVLTGLAARPQPAVRRRRLRPALAGIAAALAIALLSGGAVWWRTADDRQLAHSYRETLSVAHGRYLRAAPLLADGTTPVGQMYALQGSPSWVSVVLQGGTWSGRCTVRVHARDGRVIDLGTMTVRDGQGFWGYMISLPVSEILSVDLNGPYGPIMTARLA